jgi:hypothetical protein
MEPFHPYFFKIRSTSSVGMTLFEGFQGLNNFCAGFSDSILLEICGKGLGSNKPPL